jgi:hypothetical protein
MAKTQYAAHRGCQPFAVDYALKTGRIHAESNGLIDSEQADRDWDEHTDVLRSRILPHNGGHANGVQSDGGRQPKTIAYLEARTKREHTMIELKELELEIRRRDLVPRKEMEAGQKLVYAQVRAVRDACLDMPDRLSAELAGETDPHKVHEILRREICAVFERFAEGAGGEAAA